MSNNFLANDSFKNRIIKNAGLTQDEFLRLP